MICLISGVDTVGGTPSSGAIVDEAEDPDVRTVLDNSDNRVSGLKVSKVMWEEVHSSVGRTEEDDVA